MIYVWFESFDAPSTMLHASSLAHPLYTPFPYFTPLSRFYPCSPVSSSILLPLLVCWQEPTRLHLAPALPNLGLDSLW